MESTAAVTLLGPLAPPPMDFNEVLEMDHRNLLEGLQEYMMQTLEEHELDVMMWQRDQRRSLSVAMEPPSLSSAALLTLQQGETISNSTSNNHKNRLLRPSRSNLSLSQTSTPQVAALVSPVVVEASDRAVYPPRRLRTPVVQIQGPDPLPPTTPENHDRQQQRLQKS